MLHAILSGRPGANNGPDSRCVNARPSIAYFTRTVLALRKKLTSSRQGPSIRANPVRLAMTVPTSLLPFRTSQPPRKRMPTAPAPLIALRANLEESFRRKILRSVSKTSRDDLRLHPHQVAFGDPIRGVAQRLDALSHPLIETPLKRDHDPRLRSDHAEHEHAEPGLAR